MPAAYLGRFSSDTSKRLRQRPLWVRDRRRQSAFIQAAERVAWQVGLYDVEDNSLGVANTLDIAWGYERELPNALTMLAEHNAALDGKLWITTLVPFIAGLFVRGPEFHTEYTKRFPAGLENVIPRIADPDHSTAGRLIDFQLILVAVMTCKWSVLHFSKEVELITSDTGYAATLTPAGDGYVIPIDRHTALALTWSPRREVLRWNDDSWAACIDHYVVTDEEAPDLCRSMGAFARHAIYGPTQESVDSAAANLSEAPRIGPGLLGDPGGIDFGCHIYDYFRVVSAAHATPTNAQGAIEAIDWAMVQQSWTAPVVVELLFAERTKGGVKVLGDTVSVSLDYGIAIRKVRRAAGDFRLGAMSFLELPFTGPPPDRLPSSAFGS